MSDENTTIENEPAGSEAVEAGGETPTPDEVAKWKHFSRENEKAAKAAQRELEETRKRLAELEESQKSDQEKALDAAAREAEARVREEYESKMRAAELQSAVLKTAAGRLADPDDALRFLDTSDLDPSDSDAVASRINALLEEKPYLGVAASKRGPEFEQGAQGEQEPDLSAMSPAEYRKWKRGEAVSVPRGPNSSF